jgi:hypothetical protein
VRKAAARDNTHAHAPSIALLHALTCAAASESAAAARAASGPAAGCAAGEGEGGGGAVDSRSTGSTNWRKTAYARTRLIAPWPHLART